jgi:prepilin-type N-terminal cleavage/methylation domain-containing protein
MHLRRVRDAGFTIVELMIVVAVIGLLASIAMPSYSRARQNAQINSIGNNLRLLEAAKAQCALDNRLSTGQTIAMNDLTPYLRSNQLPKPVVGETYSIAGAGTVADFIQAVFAGTIGGKTSPVTITSFD